MQLSNQFSRSKVGQKTNALHNPPVKVLVDGVVVAGSSAPGDAPPDSTCGDAPCSRAPLPLQAGAHTVQITGSGTPGVEAAATLVGLYGGELVLATDGSWQAYAAPSASSSPPATRSAFGLAQAGAGGLALAVSNASGACGLPQLVLSGGAARFSVSQNSSVLAWAEGGRQLLVGAGALGACNGKLVVDAGSTSWLLLPQGAGGWALCLAGNRSSCAAPAADGSVSLGAAAPWLVLESPLVTATLGPLAGWLDGADTSSFALSGDGSVVAWQDTRDAGLWAPRALRASGTSVAYAGFACPVNLWDTAGAAMASQLRDGSPALAWDWALPTTLVLVLSQAQPGALLTLLDAHGSVYELALQGGGGPLSPALYSREAGAWLQGAPAVPRGAAQPTVLAVARTAASTWVMWVDGAQALRSTPLAATYSADQLAQVLGDAAAAVGCVHEIITYAAALSPAGVATITAHLHLKWGAAPPPPAPPAAGPKAALPVSSWPAAAQNGSAVCLAGAGSVDYAGALPTDGGTYVITFLAEGG